MCSKCRSVILPHHTVRSVMEKTSRLSYVYKKEPTHSELDNLKKGEH